MDNLFTSEKVLPAIIKMCIPVVISMLVVVAYNMVDLFFVSLTNDSYQIAAVSLANPVFMLLMAVGSLAGGGGTVSIARSLGAKEDDKSKAYSSLCAWSMIIIGCCIMAFILIKTDWILSFVGADSSTWAYTSEYIRILGLGSIFIIFSSGYANLIRSEGAVKVAMISNLLSTIVNLTFDPIFILLLHWGVKGAAMATVMGNIFGCIYLLYYIKTKSSLSISIKDIHLSFKDGIYMFYLGFPNATSNLVSSINNTIQNQILVVYGATTIAAFGVASKIQLIVSMICLGMGMGIQPLLAYNVGAKNTKRINEIIKTSILISLFITIIAGLGCIVFKEQFARIFFSDTEMISLVSKIVTIQMISCPLYGLIYITINYLQSCKKATLSTILSIARQGWLLIPFSIIMNKIWGLNGFFFSTVIADLLTSIICLILLLKNRPK